MNFDRLLKMLILFLALASVTAMTTEAKPEKSPATGYKYEFPKSSGKIGGSANLKITAWSFTPFNSGELTIKKSAFGPVVPSDPEMVVVPEKTKEEAKFVNRRWEISFTVPIQIIKEGEYKINWKISFTGGDVAKMEHAVAILAEEGGFWMGASDIRAAATSKIVRTLNLQDDQLDAKSPEIFDKAWDKWQRNRDALEQKTK